MSLSEFSDYLNKFQEMLPDISNKISDDEFCRNLQDTTQKMIELIPSTQKILKDSQTLLEAFSSWQKENERLQKALLSLGMPPTISIATPSISSPQTQENAEKTVTAATCMDEPTTSDENEEQVSQTAVSATSEQQNDSEVKQENSCDNEPEESEESEESEVNEQTEASQRASQVVEEKKPALTKVDANTLEESKDAFSNAPLDISPSSAEEDKPQVTISTPQKHHDSVENKHLYFNEDEVMKELQIDANELEQMVNEKKLAPTIIEDTKYFSKKKVSLLRSVAMESSTVVIEKPVKQPLIFGSGKKETAPKEDTKDYYNENEVMEELQTDLDGLEKMIEQKKLIPTMIDGKRYFPKRKVALLRSMAMELSTIVIQKPKKKNPLNFWKDN